MDLADHKFHKQKTGRGNFPCPVFIYGFVGAAAIPFFLFD